MRMIIRCFDRDFPAITKGSCRDPFVLWLVKLQVSWLTEPRENDGFDENTELSDNGRLTKTANLTKFFQISYYKRWLT